MAQTKHFIKILANNSKIPQHKIKKFINAFKVLLAEKLSQGQKITIRNLGTFNSRNQKLKIVKNLQNNQGYQVSARKIPVFYPSKNLRKTISKKFVFPIYEEKLNHQTEKNTKIPVQVKAKTSLWKALFDKTKVPPPTEQKLQKPIPPSELIQEKTPNKLATRNQKVNNSNLAPIEAKVPEYSKISEAVKISVNPKTPEKIQAVQKNIISAINKPIPSNAQTPYIDLRKKKIPKEILLKIPEYIARLYQVIPVEEQDDKLRVAMVDPEDYQAIEFIKKKTGMEIEPLLSTQQDISYVLNEYSGIESEIEKEIKKSDLSKISSKTEKTDEEITKTDAPTARAVHSILRKAVLSNASDIHIEPYENEIIVRFRIDGVLQKIISLPKAIQSAIISRIKILSNMRIDETRLPQDGRFELTIDKREIDFRISVFPTVFGEKAVIRILDKSSNILSLEDLGLRGSAYDILNESIKKSHGMILVTGPTGSGKTTTLYAILKKLNKVGVNIVTLEDPVEYQIKGINQSQVRPEIGFTFAKGLRSLVRQDPDVIMIGEIRDLETAEMAIQSALTGHVVLSTLHTNDAAGAIPRLIDMQIEPFLITSSINSVIGQRLCRKICENCKEQTELPEETIKEIKEEITKMPPPIRKETEKKELIFYRGKGCDACNQVGYSDRIGIFEIFNVSEAIKELTLQRVSANTLVKKAIEEGMVTMKQDGILKALDGITTIEEVWRVTKE